MTRRSVLTALSAAVAGAAFDLERALWMPGKKLISIPKPVFPDPPLWERPFIFMTQTMTLDEFCRRYPQHQCKVACCGANGDIPVRALIETGRPDGMPLLRDWWTEIVPEQEAVLLPSGHIRQASGRLQVRVQDNHLNRIVS